MALSADVSRKFGISEGPHSNKPVKASATIYQGAAVGDSSGYMRGLVAADVFCGFAWAKADNSAGSNGDIDVEIREKGEVELTVVGVTSVDDEDQTVYATADGTFTLTASGASSIGKVKRYVSTGVAVVYFEAANLRSI